MPSRGKRLKNTVIAGPNQGQAKFSLAARRLQNHSYRVDAPPPSTFADAWALHWCPLPASLHMLPRYAGLRRRRPCLLALRKPYAARPCSSPLSPAERRPQRSATNAARFAACRLEPHRQQASLFASCCRRNASTRFVRCFADPSTPLRLAQCPRTIQTRCGSTGGLDLAAAINDQIW